MKSVGASPGRRNPARHSRGFVLVIGFGNPLRGDDGLGPRAVERLERAPLPDGVTLLARPQLTPELARDVAQADLVVFIDAAASGAPGTVSCEPVEPARGQAAALAHSLDPAGLLALTLALYGRAPRAYQAAIAGGDFALAEGLSEPVERALPGLLQRVRRLLTTGNT